MLYHPEKRRFSALYWSWSVPSITVHWFDVIQKNWMDGVGYSIFWNSIIVSYTYLSVSTSAFRYWYWTENAGNFTIRIMRVRLHRTCGWKRMTKRFKTNRTSLSGVLRVRSFLSISRSIPLHSASQSTCSECDTFHFSRNCRSDEFRWFRKRSLFQHCGQRISLPFHHHDQWTTSKFQDSFNDRKGEWSEKTVRFVSNQEAIENGKGSLDDAEAVGAQQKEPEQWLRSN